MRTVHPRAWAERSVPESIESFRASFKRMGVPETDCKVTWDTVEGGRLGCVEHEALLTEDVSGDVIPLDPILRSLGMPTRTRSVEAAGAWVAREMERRGVGVRGGESGRRAVGYAG